MQEMLGWEGNPTGRTTPWLEDPTIPKLTATLIDEDRMTETSAAELAAAPAEGL
jgi:hypothetical protein